MDAHLILFAVFIHRWFFLFLSVSSQNIISSIIFSLAQKIVSKSIYSNVNTQIWDHQSREMERAYRIYIERSYENRPLLLYCYIFDGYALMCCGIHS